METDIHSIEVFLKLLRESQLRIDTLLEKIDAQQLTDCPKVKSKIQVSFWSNANYVVS